MKSNVQKPSDKIKFSKKDVDRLWNEIEYKLRNTISDDYTCLITNLIIDDVIQDIELCCETGYNEDDVKLAVGRAILNKMNFSV